MKTSNNLNDLKSVKHLHHILSPFFYLLNNRIFLTINVKFNGAIQIVQNGQTFIYNSFEFEDEKIIFITISFIHFNF